jgi:hypothetical protein
LLVVEVEMSFIIQNSEFNTFETIKKRDTHFPDNNR